MRPENKIIVMSGGTLQIDEGRVTNANILIKQGGSLIVKNNGKIILSKFGTLKSEKGAIMNLSYGDVQISD